MKEYKRKEKPDKYILKYHPLNNGYGIESEEINPKYVSELQKAYNDMYIKKCDAEIKIAELEAENYRVKQLLDKAWILLEIVEPNADITEEIFQYLGEQEGEE